MKRPGQKTLDLWRRRAASAETGAEEWRRMIAEGEMAGVDAHKLGVWRSKMIACQNQARALRARVERASA